MESLGFYLKTVECYNGDDMVQVLVATKNGSDKSAINKLLKEMPELEVSDISDVDGFWSVTRLTDLGWEFYDDMNGVMILEEGMYNPKYGFEADDFVYDGFYDPGNDNALSY